MTTTPIATDVRPTLPIGQRVLAKVVARRGVWAITPWYSGWLGFASDLYTVTHIPSGLKASDRCLGLSSAKRLLAALAGLPNQEKWSGATVPSKIPKRMLAAAKAAFLAEVERTDPTEEAGKEQP